MTTSNLSTDALRKMLNDQEYYEHRIGGLIFIAVLMPFGIVGNILILVVYGWKMNPSNHRLFILTLGVIDLMMCIVGMPFVIVERRLPLLFDMSTACKVLLLHNFMAALSSTFLLLVIAIERYRKVCQPLKKQITLTQAKRLVFFVFVIALCMSWPSFILYGRNTETWPNPYQVGANITGFSCYVEDQWTDTKVYVGYHLLLLGLLLCVSSVLGFLYLSVAKVIARSAAKFNPSKRPSELSSKSSETEFKPRGSSITTSDVRQVGSISSRKMRTTLIFILITVLYLLSYAPYLAIELTLNIDKNFLRNLPSAGQVFINTFKETYFINHVVNVILYGICDYRFRENVKSLLVNLFCNKDPW